MTTTTTGIGVHDQNLEKQIEKHMGGCMAGFFNLFDRQHFLSPKRHYPKRLPPSTVSDSASEPVSSVGSPAISREFEKPQLQPPPKSDLRSPAPAPAPESPLAVSSFEFKKVVKSPWKFNREAPRLSLDSRAVVDAKGGLRPREIRTGDVEIESQRKSPSVIAKLMGLEPVPIPSSSDSESGKKAELRRSASESRSRDYRFFDTSSFLSPISSKNETLVDQKPDPTVNNHNHIQKQKQRNQQRSMVERRKYYDTADFFPQQQNQAVTVYGEIEKRLRMRGIDETSKDLETLKYILEALQLKGLLHSSAIKPHHNDILDRRFSPETESPVVLMKPVSPLNRRRLNEPPVSPVRERTARSPIRSPGRRSGPVVRRVETTTSRCSHSPIQSPRSDRKVNRSPRNKRSTVEICQGRRVFSGPASAEGDEASIVSESSFSTSSHTDNERWKGEDYREGRNLLQRCDKLLQSIAEMTANSNSNSPELQQPSPVSVLDSSFYKEDESSPSPVKKRTIDFKDQVVMELEDESWTPSSSSSGQLLKLDHDVDSSDDSDFTYVSEVFRVSNYLPEDTNLFFLLEKQISIRSKDKSKSKASLLRRKLIFDTIIEILDRNRQLAPWKSISFVNPGSERPTLEQIWSEFKKIREHGPSGDLFEAICGVLKKDLARDSLNGWVDCLVEMSEVVLDIERLIFKDLIGETIRDVAAFAGKIVGSQQPRRKLVF